MPLGSCEPPAPSASAGARAGGSQEEEMATQAEVEAVARVLCRVAYFQLPANERICSADIWPDVEIAKGENSLRNSPFKRWETFGHEARLALEAAEHARSKLRLCRAPGPLRELKRVGIHPAAKRD